MFKAILLICSLISGSGDKNNCIQLHDTIEPNGYPTEEQCMARIHEMANVISQSLPFPHHIRYKCENTIQRTEHERK